MTRINICAVRLVILLTLFCAKNASASNVETSGSPGKHSIAVQIGMNGIAQKSETYSMQILPPDVSYSYEFFDNNRINISTSTFYDNVGVEVLDTNFTYRVGQRIDIGMEFKRYVPYITAGFGAIKNNHHFQTSPVYGFGFLTKISKKLALVNEINFQHVRYQNSGYDILNASLGLVYTF